MVGLKERPMKEVSLDERREILLELQTEKSRIVRDRHGISSNTLQHIRFFHGGSSAKARGYYHKDLLEGATDPKIEKLKALKAEGMNSGQASERTGIELEKVNKLWPTL